LARQRGKPPPISSERSIRITLDEFLERIQRYKIEEADPRVLINADERALFAQVVYVVDQVRLAQIPKIYIETRIFQSK